MARTPKPQSLYRMLGYSSSASDLERDQFARAQAELIQIWLDAGILRDYYTGISNSILDRLKQHATNTVKGRWWREMVVIIPEHLTPGITRRNAEAIELARIGERAPAFNIKGNKGRYDHRLAAWAYRRYREAFDIPLSAWERNSALRWIADHGLTRFTGWVTGGLRTLRPYAIGSAVGFVVTSAGALILIGPA